MNNVKVVKDRIVRHPVGYFAMITKKFSNFVVVKAPTQKRFSVVLNRS